MAKTTPFLVLLALSSASVEAQSFVDVTPAGVDVGGTVSLDPRDPDHLLINGSSLLESFDAGTTWLSVGPFPGTGGALDANGDLVLIDSGTPFGSGPLIWRRTAAGLVALPSPVAPGPPEFEFAFEVTCHPTRPDSLALLTISDNLDTGEITLAVYATEDSGVTWITVASAVSDNDGTGLIFRDVAFVPTEVGDGLLVSTRFSDLEFFTTSVRLYAPDFQSFASEISAMDAHCGVAASRTLPGRRYAYLSNNPIHVPGSPSIQRREPGGSYGSVGDEGSFIDVAAGNVDPGLVVRLQSPVPGTILSVSRDAGETWSLLADPTSGGYAASEIFGLTSTDGHAYVRARGPGNNRRRLLRVPVESAVGGEECAGVVNSTGRVGVLSAVGRSEVSANRFLLSIRDLPAHSCYLPLVSRDSGFLANPGGSDGNLCLGGHVGRALEAMGMVTAWGESSTSIDLTRLPGPNAFFAATEGETLRFQVWYRDCAGLGASNLTNSVVATFD